METQMPAVDAADSPQPQSEHAKSALTDWKAVATDLGRLIGRELALRQLGAQVESDIVKKQIRRRRVRSL